MYAPSDSRSLMYCLTHVEFFRFLRLFKTVAGPKLAATSRLEQAAMTTPSPATSTMFTYLEIQVRSMDHATHAGHATHEQVFGLDSIVDFGHATRHERSRKSETS